MKTSELVKMSRQELTDLKKRVESALTTLEDRERDAARKAAEDAAKKFGYSLSELGVSGGKRQGKRKGAGSRSVNPPKYRHPENPATTWSGRGRKPQWIKEAEEKGTLAKLAI